MDLESIFGGFGAPKCTQTTLEIEVKKTLKIECQNDPPGRLILRGSEVPDAKSTPTYSTIEHTSLYINIRLLWHAQAR